MRNALLIAIVATCWLPSVASGQTGSAEPAGDHGSDDDVEARRLFEMGEAAFSEARYEEALSDFRRAYELSGRFALQYNIGLTASRLRRDDEALAALEQFVSEAPEGTAKLEDARARIDVLRAHQDEGVEARDDAGPSLLGPMLVGVVGLGLVAIPIVGVVTTDDCSDVDAAGMCVEQRSLNPVWAGVYGGAGVLALAGAVLWLVMSGSGESDAAPSARLGPGSLEVSF